MLRLTLAMCLLAGPAIAGPAKCELLLLDDIQAKYYAGCVRSRDRYLEERSAKRRAFAAALGASLMAESQRDDEPLPHAHTSGMYAGERDNGGNKLCFYNKYGQSSVETVGKFESCPR